MTSRINDKRPVSSIIRQFTKHGQSLFYIKTMTDYFFRETSFRESDFPGNVRKPLTVCSKMTNSTHTVAERMSWGQHLSRKLLHTLRSSNFTSNFDFFSPANRFTNQSTLTTSGFTQLPSRQRLYIQVVASLGFRHLYNLSSLYQNWSTHITDR